METNGKTVVIGIDHGNGNMKTAHCVFPCGIKTQETKPSELFSPDVIEFNKSFTSLSANRLPYEIDKTKNDNCLKLTLLAASKEIVSRAREGREDFDFKRDFSGFVGKDVVLAVGLPPAHLEKQQENFIKYFKEAGKYGFDYRYNDKPFCFYLKDVMVFPQCYAAVMVFKQELLKKYSTVYAIDIGDGTVDLLGLKNGVPDKAVMVSREHGMSKLRNQIIDDVINDYNMTLDDAIIEDILTPGKEVVVPNEIVVRVKEETARWASYIVDQLHSKVPDFRFAPTIFCGGGATLLRPYLEDTGMFGITDYIEDIHANAVGYEQIAKLLLNG